MDGVLQSTFTIIFIVEFIIGNLGNAFLALLNCMDYVKKRKISFVDHILTALAISRIVLLWLLFTIIIIHSLYPELVITAKLGRMIFFLAVIGHISLWLATSLNVVYLLKIANFSNSIFLYLRWRVKKVISVTLLVSLFLLFLFVLLLNTHSDTWIDGYKTNMSDSSSSISPGEFHRVLTFYNAIFLFIPTTISLSAFLVLIFSLWKHLRKMQRNATGPRDVSTTAHVKALQIMTTSVLLFTTLFLLSVVGLWRSELLREKNFSSIILAAGITMPSVHTWVLILGNSKLRRASDSVLLRLRCKSKDEETSPPKSHQESSCISREISVH